MAQLSTIDLALLYALWLFHPQSLPEGGHLGQKDPLGQLAELLV
jgi:hypothetical protein